MNKKILFGIILGIIIVVIIITNLNINRNFVLKDQEYTIGLVVPLSEIGSAVGIPMADGMKMGVNEINQNGGINGQKLNLVIEDGPFGTESVNAANYIINTQNPDILVTLFQPPAEAIAPVAIENNIPLIYDAYVRSVKNQSDIIFKANFDSASGCEELIRFAKENNKYTKLAVVFPQIGFSEECFDGIKKVEPNVEEFWYNVEEKDYKTILLKANQKNIDTIFVVGFDYHFINLFSQLKKYNYSMNVIAATTSEALPQEVFENVDNDFLEGTLTIDFIDIEIDNSDFAKNYANYTNRNNLTHLDYAYAAEGYDHVMIISKAMENCEPKDTDCLVNALENVKDHITVNGNTGFENRILQNTNKIYEYHNGNWVRLN